MLYVPGKFLFIHIPRTGGNTITRTICESLVTRENVVCWTDPTPAVIHRHSRAVELVPLLPDFHRLQKFAVDRPYAEIVKSYYALLEKTGFLINNETLEEFETRKFVPWLCGRSPWEHWCCDDNGNELGVHRLEFGNVDWGWVRKTTNLPDSVIFQKQDWQTQYLTGTL